MDPKLQLRGLLRVMGAKVALTVGCLRECSRTLGALEGLLATVRSHVVFHVSSVARGVRAQAAH